MKPEGVRAYRSRRRTILTRLKRVSRALRRWDEYEAQELLPVPPTRPVERPQLSREALKALQKMLTELLSPIEEMWERRN